MTKKVTILVATSTLVLGKPKGADENLSLPTGEELTKEISDSVGLKKTDIEDMVARGHLLLTEVRAAESGRGNDAAIVAAEARAQQAIDDLAGANTRADTAEALVKTLQADLAAANKGGEDAEKDYEELEKHVTVLEKQIEDLTGERDAAVSRAEAAEGQIEKLTADLAEATKPPAADAKAAAKA